jgi:hypothetical protein
MLPDESHQYESRESIGHVLWEMTRWFDRYVKGAKTASGKKAASTAQLAKPPAKTMPIEKPVPKR